MDVPLYALQTSLTKGPCCAARGGSSRARRSRAGARVLVDASATQSHLDPLAAAPERNRYLQTVVPFLKRLR